jgi:hypothetical protein
MAKRQHQPGYFFTWNNYNSKITKNTIQKEKKKKNVETFDTIHTYASKLTQPEAQQLNLDTCPNATSTKTIQLHNLKAQNNEKTREKMLMQAKRIKILHRFKQAATIGGMFYAIVKSFAVASSAFISYPFLYVMIMLILLSIALSAVSLLVVISVSKFKKNYADFSDDSIYQETLKFRKKARNTLIFTYALFTISLVLLVFGYLVAAVG